MNVFVIPMPLNREGNGPEMDPNLIWEVRWQVWDSDTFECLAEYPSQEEAVYQAELLNASLSGM